MHIYNEKKALSFWLFFFYLLLNFFFLFVSSSLSGFVFLCVSHCYSLTNNIFVCFVAMPSFSSSSSRSFVSFVWFFFISNITKKKKHVGKKACRSDMIEGMSVGLMKDFLLLD